MMQERRSWWTPVKEELPWLISFFLFVTILAWIDYIAVHYIVLWYYSMYCA